MSTSLALVDFVVELRSNIDNKWYTVGVFIDLKIVFDTIDHKNLIRKLEFYGIRVWLVNGSFHTSLQDYNMSVLMKLILM